MKQISLWIILSIAASPAFADPLDTNVGNSERFQRPPAITFPFDATPGCSIAIGVPIAGATNLYRQHLPANLSSTVPGNCNIAIGSQVMLGKITAAAVNNIGFGYGALNTLSSGSNNICMGSDSSGLEAGACAAITSYSNNIMIGPGAGAGYGGAAASNNDIILEAEGDESGNQGSNDICIDIHGCGGTIGSGMTLLGDNSTYQGQYTCTNFTTIGFNTGRLNACNGGAETNVILIGALSNASAPDIVDTATTTTGTAIGIGGFTGSGQGNHPGVKDTSIGIGSLHTNAQDNADQVSLGYEALNTSNVASAENSALGYLAGKTLTTGTNNLFMGWEAGDGTLTTGNSNIILGSGITTPASGTASMLNIGGLVYGHLAGTSNPTVTACGTSPSADSNSNNASGTITVGTGTVASCTITFSSPYTTWNHCKVTSHTGALAGFAYSYTTSAITITATSLTSDLFDYVCDGY